MPLALSTMWAQQDRFRGDFTRFVEIAREAGYGAIEVSHATDVAGLRECLGCGVLPVVSLHAPTPYSVDLRGRGNTALNLAGVDEDERQAAVAAHRQTIDFAADAGARAVVVHFGSLDGGVREHERRLRERYAAGEIEGDAAVREQDAARAARAAAAPPHVEAMRRSLAELVAYATPRGVALGLENRLHYWELPSPEEAADLLAGYAPSEAGHWHDVGHAEVWSRLGLTPHARWFELLGGRTIGAHLHDVRDLVDHRSPGRGTVDWPLIRAGIPPAAMLTCEIDQHEPEASLAEAVRFLAAQGIIPAP